MTTENRIADFFAVRSLCVFKISFKLESLLLRIGNRHKTTQSAVSRTLTVLCCILVHLQVFAQGNKKIDSLENVLATYSKLDTNRVNLYTDLARRYTATKNQNKALDYAQQALILSEKLRFDAGKHDALIAEGLVYSSTGQVEKALSNYLKANDIASKVNDKNRQIGTKLNIASAYAALSRYEEGLLAAQSALEIAKQDQLAELKQTYCLNFISNIQIKRGNYDRAIENILAALTLAEKANDARAKGTNYRSLALCHSRLENYESAAKYAQMALVSTIVASDKRELARTYLILGKANSKLKKNDESIKSLQMAMSLATEVKDEISVASALSAIGDEYIALKKPDSARMYLDKARLAANKMGDKQLLSIVNSQIADFYTQQAGSAINQDSKRALLDASLYAAHEALGTATNAGLPEERKIAFLRLSDTYLQQGNYGAALESFKNYKNLSDSIANMQKREQLVRMQAQYDVEAKSRELEIANKEVLLRGSDLEKAKLLAEQIKLAAENERERNRFLLAENELNDTELEKQWAVQRKMESDNLAKLKENQLLKKEKELQNLELETQKEQNRLQLGLLAAGLSLLLLFGIVLFVLYRSNAQKKRSNQLLQTKNDEINEQKLIIEKKGQSITASINYALRIQKAILPQQNVLNALLPEHFIFMKPRDIVSGDFYRVDSYHGRTLIAICDCTGHGVPGAIMSMIANDLLNLVTYTPEPLSAGAILSRLHTELCKSLHKEDTASRDGMDIALCLLNRESNAIEFAGAHSPLYWIAEGQCNEVKGNAFSIGEKKTILNFDTHHLQFPENTQIYFASDGYRDQFGGPNNRRFQSRNLKNLFLRIHQWKADKQSNELDKVLTDWRLQGNERQTDDILIFGMRL